MRKLFVIALAVALSSLTITAHVVISAEFREVVSDATLIVRGRVTDVRAVDAGPIAGVESVATVAVETVLKGQASSFVYVRVPGGQLGQYKYVMVGAPTFKAGQRAVFFLRPGVTDTAYRPIGLTMGVFRVQADPQNGQPVVEPPLVGGKTAALTGPAVRGDVRRRLMPVPEFESLVRLVMATPSGQAAPRWGGR
jgi:hypothetical protein